MATVKSSVGERLLYVAGRISYCCQLPLWFLALFTGAKAFSANPILGSPVLNRAGLHVWRLKAAHALALWRRARLTHLLPRELREEFQRNGFIVITDVFPGDEFLPVQSAILETERECRLQDQGDTITRRVPVGAKLRREIPQLSALLDSPRWKGLMAYVASARTQPLYYIQTIAGGVTDGPPDPQQELHSDTFHPSLKAWLFLEDVGEEGRPLIYVPGSHRLSAARLDWEYCKSVDVLVTGDSLSKRGSLRIDPDELRLLGLPPPTKICVAANTLVLIDTCGFHARAKSEFPTVRVELWAYCRRTPFLPWTFGGPFSWPPLADRRAEWLNVLGDWLDWSGVRQQYWTLGGWRRPKDF